MLSLGKLNKSKTSLFPFSPVRVYVLVISKRLVTGKALKIVSILLLSEIYSAFYMLRHQDDGQNHIYSEKSF
jgi:hypothetical protein